MKIKKILSSALALIMALSLCACADSDTQDVTGTNEVTEAVDEVLTEDESVSSLALVSTAADITEILDGLGYSANIIIADKQSQIETLESYKKSLIYEYVTGKKEVG